MPESFGRGRATASMTCALAADELPPHHSSDVPLAFGKVDPQNPSCFASRSVALCATIGARFGFLGRVHRKNWLRA